MAFRMLGAGNFPSHRTICEFRRRHLEDFGKMFVEVVRVAREMGVVRFGKLSIDGTKVRASASKRKAMSYERMLKEEAGLKEEIEGLLAQAGAVDAEEDKRGEDVRGDCGRVVPRPGAIRAAKEQPYKRDYERQSQTPRAGEDQHGRVPAVTTHRRWWTGSSRSLSRRMLGRRPRTRDCLARRGGTDVHQAGGGAGGRRLLQRGGPCGA